MAALHTYPSTTYPSSTQTIYAPVAHPPTPAPSPRPISELFSHGISVAADTDEPSSPHASPAALANAFASLPSSARLDTLSTLVSLLSVSELAALHTLLAPLLKRNFLSDLPPELALHVLRLTDSPQTLCAAQLVSRRWNELVRDDSVWRAMCARWDFTWPDAEASPFNEHRRAPTTWRGLYIYYYSTQRNWKHRPAILRTHRLPTPSTDPNANTITSSALSRTHLVTGLANARIHVFNAQTGVPVCTLIGHEHGVWAVCLVTAGGAMDPRHKASTPAARVSLAYAPDVRSSRDAHLRHNRTPPGSAVVDPDGLDHLLSPTMRRVLALDTPPKYLSESLEFERDRTDPCGTARGWGQPGALVVSGGCDKNIRVWDVETGLCLYVLRGHTSTVRCLRVLNHRPWAVSGARDGTLRVWDIQRGKMARRLIGHTGSVRALDICGNQVVSGSYDHTCRLWDIDTGACLQVFRGHTHQIYCVVFDGERVASGGVDTTVRVWDARSGVCMAQLQVHTALVCQLQLTPTMLVSGGADGRVLLYSLAPTEHGLSIAVTHRLAAHDSSITALQLVCDGRFLVTGGADGRSRLWEVRGEGASGRYVREMSEGGEVAWGVVFRNEGGAVMCRRQGKMLVEMWEFAGETQ